jgi:signal transduction histidine kinase
MMAAVLVHITFLVILILVIKSIAMTTIVIIAITGVIVFLSVALRHHYPILFFFCVTVLIVIQGALLDYPTVSWMVLPMAVFDVARHLKPRTSYIYLSVALISTSLGPLRWLLVVHGHDPDLRTTMVLIGLSMAGVVTTAYSIGRRRRDADQARIRQKLSEERAAQLELAEKTARQRSVEHQIRTAVARELHDIVAHSISVMVVQAEGGLAQASRSPSTAQLALTTISETGREALEEMRRIVRTLRSEADVAAETLSAPTLGDISSLVEKAQATLTVSGTPHGSTPSIELTVYRVIQEALTNSLKHGGPDADPQVAVIWNPTDVSVTITNNVSGPPRPNDHRGTGLIGMAERVQALDGTVTVGPSEKGGFRVCAQIPLQTSHLES